MSYDIIGIFFSDVLELPGLSRGRAQSQIRASTRFRKLVAVIFCSIHGCDALSPTLSHSPRPARRVPQRPDISGPINFTHVQHFGPYQSLNPEDMPVSICICILKLMDHTWSKSCISAAAVCGNACLQLCMATMY